jgi:hypothetical protein
MTGTTSHQRFCWLQVDFRYGRCTVTHFGASNGSNWPFAGAAVIEIVTSLLMDKLLIPTFGLEQAVP